jgi:hypothetical protein
MCHRTGKKAESNRGQFAPHCPKQAGSCVGKACLTLLTDGGTQNNRVSWWIQPVEGVYKKLIIAKGLVTTICAHER